LLRGFLDLRSESWQGQQKHALWTIKLHWDWKTYCWPRA
jgi:hypothetical protein